MQPDASSRVHSGRGGRHGGGNSSHSIGRSDTGSGGRKEDCFPEGSRPTQAGAGQNGRGSDDPQRRNLARPGSLDRLLRHAYSRGVRYFDTAKAYGTEDRFKKWFAAMPEVRKEIFLATKDHVDEPRQMIRQLDHRLEALGTDYIDLLFFHALGSRQVDWPRSKAMKDAAEALKKTGKVRFVGFSTHDAQTPRTASGRGRGWLHRRDHASVHALARQVLGPFSRLMPATPRISGWCR